MNNFNWSANAERNLTQGVLDYVDSAGELHTDIPARAVLIRNADDRALLTGYLTGTIAFTAGGSAWMKTADGTWEDWPAGITTVPAP